MGLFRLLGVLSLLGAAACAGAATTIPGFVEFQDQRAEIEAVRVPLGVGGADLAPGVRYAGGYRLRGRHTHGLSDLKVEGVSSNALVVWAVSDFGDLLRFSISLDDEGRMEEIRGGVVRRLRNPDGSDVRGKSQGDAEGLALLHDGRFVVSFEGEHRIVADRLIGSALERLPSPDVDFPPNRGMEGLSRGLGRDWLVLGEGGGAWICAPAGCRVLAGAPAEPADGFSFTGADQDPDGGWFVVERRFRAPFDLRVRVRRMAPDGTLSAPLIALSPPASVDNFEGVAAVARGEGVVRLFLLSDDNANPLQKTLLLAFDLPRR